jgi:hypothetical protein
MGTTERNPRPLYDRIHPRRRWLPEWLRRSMAQANYIPWLGVKDITGYNAPVL